MPPTDDTNVETDRDGLLEQIVDVNRTFRQAEAERRRLMLKGNLNGLSTRQIARATGEHAGSIAYWIKRAREQADSH